MSCIPVLNLPDGDRGPRVDRGQAAALLSAGEHAAMALPVLPQPPGLKTNLRRYSLEFSGRHWNVFLSMLKNHGDP